MVKHRKIGTVDRNVRVAVIFVFEQKAHDFFSFCVWYLKETWHEVTKALQT